MPQVWVLLSHEESDISISYHHWNLHSVKPSLTSFKSQDTLNIFRRTRGYPSVLRKVWPVYCSIQSLGFGCSWRKNSTRDIIQLPLFWLYQGKSFQDFLFKNFLSDFRLLRVWDKSLSDQNAGKYRLKQLLRVTYSTTEERNNSKNDQTFLENYFVCRLLLCLFERTVQTIKFCRGNFYGYSWAKEVKIV